MTFAPAMTFAVEGVSRILRRNWDSDLMDRLGQ
jgi:hypothetical protein